MWCGYFKCHGNNGIITSLTVLQVQPPGLPPKTDASAHYVHIVSATGSFFLYEYLVLKR